MNSQYDHLFKMLFIGDSGVGKSAIINKHVDNTFNDSRISTIGVDFKISTQEVNGKLIKLQIWDTAGQERFRSIVNSYYRGGQCIVIVFDLTDVESFNKISFWIEEIKQYGQSNPPPVIFIVGNKVDRQRKISYDEAKTTAESFGAKYIETSAKQNINIDQLFTDIASSLLEIYKDKKYEHVRPPNNSRNTSRVTVVRPFRDNCCPY